MLRTLSRYFVIQVAAYAIDMGAFLLLTASGACGPLPANAAGKLLAGLFAFFAHSRITFGSHTHGNAREQFIRYMVLLGINVPLSSAVLSVCLHFIHFGGLAKVVSDGLCFGLTFLLARHVVFVGRAGLPERRR